MKSEKIDEVRPDVSMSIALNRREIKVKPGSIIRVDLCRV
ncbi:hypothetical protein CEB3_c41050 [Peptococcaceae bacterium CEB3]|nr:hypothetical protein CEB3_c41050 [Peptococcaceae bacterium CEB3]